MLAVVPDGVAAKGLCPQGLAPEGLPYGLRLSSGAEGDAPKGACPEKLLEPNSLPHGRRRHPRIQPSHQTKHEFEKEQLEITVPPHVTVTSQ